MIVEEFMNGIQMFEIFQLSAKKVLEMGDVILALSGPRACRKSDCQSISSKSWIRVLPLLMHFVR